MSESRIQAPPTPLSQTFWPLCFAAGALWACPALLSGAGLFAFLAVVAGATLSQACFAWSFQVYKNEPHLLAVTLATMGFVAPLGVVVLEFLRINTHHRPLGAVTFAFFLLTAAGAIWVLFWLGLRRFVRPAHGAVALVIGLCAAALASGGFSVAGGVLLELALGLLVAVAHGRLARRFAPGWPPAISWSVLGLLLIGAVLSRVPEIQQEARASAPVALGLLGLIH